MLPPATTRLHLQAIRDIGDLVRNLSSLDHPIASDRTRSSQIDVQCEVMKYWAKAHQAQA